MFKNVSGQYIFIFARDVISDAPKTGDNANLTINITGDNGALAASSNSTTELDATNAPGIYKLALTQGETNADSIVITGLSTTAGVEIIPVIIQTQTVMVGTNGANTVEPLDKVANISAFSAVTGQLVEVIADTTGLNGDPMVGTDDAATEAKQDVNDANVLFLKNVSEGDMTVDTTTTPWQMVIKIKGTSTELIRKDLKTTAGDDITSDASIIGQKLEP
jgi:hypothetical protein